MENENLGELLFSENSDDKDNFFLPIKKKCITPAGKIEFEKAKGFLSTVSPKSSLSLYDHLAGVLRKILRHKIENAVDEFEEISQSVKDEKRAEDPGLIEVSPLDKKLEEFIKYKERFYKLAPIEEDISKEIRTAEEEEDMEDEEGEEEEETKEGENETEAGEEAEEGAEPKEIDLSVVLPDLHYSMHRFHLAGIGLSPEESYELSLALKYLASDHKLTQVRFWGKIFALTCSYYVAEAPYQKNITPEDFGWNLIPDIEESSKEEEEEEETEDAAEEGEAEGGEEVEEPESEAAETEEGEEAEPEEPEVPKLPPIPEPQSKVRKEVPLEENGTGVNEYLYFVCTQIGRPWRCLPSLKPSHIVQAKQLKRFFTGNLEAEIRGCVSFAGKEAHFLRAQIARISASTFISPKDYYIVEGENDENEEEENAESEDVKNKNISKNPEYVPRPMKDVLSEGLEAWIHHRKAILDQGRCTPMKLEDAEKEEEEKENEEKSEPENEEKEENENEEKKEEEEPEILEAIKETDVPLLRSLSKDRAIGGLPPWNVKLSSRLVSETAVLIMSSNLWPGAYTFYDGKTFDNVYIGYGYKYSIYHYGPPIAIRWEKEYIVGPEVVEPVEEEVEEKEEPEDGGAEDEEKDEEKDEEEGKEDEAKDEEEEGEVDKSEAD